jgi:Spy/CpxP family protein refolding chaperone
MTRKKLLGGLISLGMVAALAIPLAVAKPNPPQSTEAPDRAAMRDRLQAAVESLNLNDDQKAKLKDVFADAHSKRETIMHDSSLTDDQRKAKMKDLHEDTMTKVNAILTPDQQTELKSKLQAARAKQQMPQ